MEKPISPPAAVPNQPSQDQSLKSLLHQPKSTSAYWLGRWHKWQTLRTQAKSKLTTKP